MKDKFWRDLEHGKINVFDSGDMYSKVKGAGVRQSRPQSFTDMYQGPRPAAEQESKPVKGKQRKKSDPARPKKATKRRSVDNDGAKRKGSRKRKSTEFSKQDSIGSVASVASDVSLVIKNEDSNSSSVVSNEESVGGEVLDFRERDVKPVISDLKQQGKCYHLFNLYAHFLSISNIFCTVMVVNPLICSP